MMLKLNEAQTRRVQLLGRILETNFDVSDLELKDIDAYTLFEANVNKELDSLDINAKKQSVDEFNNKLLQSKTILEPINKYFNDYEAKLESITFEMESLQLRLNELSKTITENEKVENDLTDILRSILITPKMINVLLNGEINQAWIEQLQELETKHSNLINNKDPNELSKISDETISLLKEVKVNLENKCIEKIKSYMIANIKSLRGVGSSPDEVQSRLLPLSSMIKLLKARIPSLANEFKSAYIYTIRWNYYYHIVKYTSTLEYCKLFEVAESSITFDNSSTNEYLINLPRRLDRLNDPKSLSIIPIEILKTTQTQVKYSIEQLVLSLNNMIFDDFSNETNFLQGFFGIEKEELAQALKLIFTPIFKIGDGFTNWIVNDTSNDYFGTLIIIRRLQRLEYKCQKNQLSSLIIGFINSQLLLLWPKFQRNIDNLCLNMTTSFGSSSLIKEVVSSKTLLIPLKITQTISTILINLIRLSQNLVFEIETTEPLTNSIQRVSDNFERGMVQLSKSLSEDKQKLFLFVNFQLVFNVLDGEVERENKQEGEEKSISHRILVHFNQLMDAYR